MAGIHTNDRTIQKFARRLLRGRASRVCSLPVKHEASRFADALLEFLFPHFSRIAHDTPREISSQLVLLERDLTHVLKSLHVRLSRTPEHLAKKFTGALPVIYHQLQQDARAIHRGDPAAESVDEVILAYPGFLAIAIYRFAHVFYRMNVPIFPRILTEYAHQLTGIDIHPGATIGSPFFIDHGTGVVIGETTVIGNDVKLYQGVTLGALSVEKRLARTKRHPTIEDGVIIYAQAVILGGSTVIGHHSVIGGNVWLTESVPPHSTVYNVSSVDVHRRGAPRQRGTSPKRR
jgi:serine O-acetyltransferase